MCKKCCIALLASFLLCGCGEPVQEEIVEQPDLRPVMQEYEWNDLLLKGITPVSSFEEQGDEIYIYPYNNNEQYISLRKIFVSTHDFWGTVEELYNGTDNIISNSKYSLVTLENHVTLCYIPIDSETAYVLESALPSGYVDLTARMICSTST